MANDADPASANQTLHAIRGTQLASTTSGSGPELIWGHGLTMTRALEDAFPLIDWSRVPATVTRYDARGHGQSTTTPDLTDYSWDALAQDQLELASALGIDRYLAAGASMGCGTALHAAIAAPDRIRGLILVIPPTAWETRAAQTDQWLTAADIVAARGVEPLITARAAIAPPDPYVGNAAQRLHRDAATRSWDPERLAQVFRGATTADLPSRNAIAGIGQPTLILAWTGDPTHPRSTAVELTELIADSELHLASTADDLARWTDLIADYVNNLET